jgi:uncharacterized protein YheU (UPF0270 family)
MIIPIHELEKDTLINLVQAYVLQEGTEYGEVDVSLDQKVSQVIQQLKAGEAMLLYSELHETVNVISQQQFASLSKEELSAL